MELMVVSDWMEVSNSLTWGFSLTWGVLGVVVVLLIFISLVMMSTSLIIPKYNPPKRINHAQIFLISHPWEKNFLGRND